MLSESEALELVGKFHRAPNYPTDEVDVLEIAADLQRVARDREQAEAIVTRCLEVSSYVPTQHDMLTVADELEPPEPPRPEPSWAPKRTVACAECGDCGRTVQVVRGYECSVLCDCAAGEKLRAVRPPEPEAKPERKRAKHEHRADADWQRRAAGDR